MENQIFLERSGLGRTVKFWRWFSKLGFRKHKPSEPAASTSISCAFFECCNRLIIIRTAEGEVDKQRERKEAQTLAIEAVLLRAVPCVAATTTSANGQRSALVEWPTKRRSRSARLEPWLTIRSRYNSESRGKCCAKIDRVHCNQWCSGHAISATAVIVSDNSNDSSDLQSATLKASNEHDADISYDAQHSDY